MMQKNEKMQEVNGVEVVGFPEEDYLPLKDYGEWRVAVLKYCENTRLENINWMQKHLLTDEVFVLLAGHCTLLIGGCGNTPEDFKTIEMKPHRLYNIKKGYWHNHILNEEGEVLIVENRNTSDENSPIYRLQEEEIGRLCECVEREV